MSLLPRKANVSRLLRRTAVAPHSRIHQFARRADRGFTGGQSNWDTQPQSTGKTQWHLCLPAKCRVCPPAACRGCRGPDYPRPRGVSTRSNLPWLKSSIGRVQSALDCTLPAPPRGIMTHDSPSNAVASDTWAARLTKLEELFAHLERTVEVLDGVLLAHARRVEQLEQELLRTRRLAESLSAQEESRDPGSEKPPHY